MNQREKQKLETKERIATAVSSLSKVYGIENLKVRDICKAADISIGTFYNYYDTVESIVKDMVIENDATTKTKILEVIKDEDELKNLETMIRFRVSVFRGYPTSLVREIFSIFLNYPEMDILEVNRSAYDVLYDIITKGQEKGQITRTLTPELMSRMILKLVIGNYFVNSMHEENYDFADSLVEEVLSIARPREHE